jgi:tRNA1(Val) A37 N6-methylase TrmN6
MSCARTGAEPPRAADLMREASRWVGVSEDSVLGGALRLRQPRQGHRVGHDAILLAAFCPARGGDRVIELGAGVGAAGLALAARVPGLTVTLIEIDPQLAALATENAKLNGLAERVRAIALDVLAPARAFTAAGIAPQSAACVLMNPPFNDPARLRASPDSRRRLAHAASMDTLPGWIKTAARLLRPRGIVTMIFRADGMAELVGHLGSAFGGLTIQPVYPRPQEPAIRILVRAARDSRGPLVLLPGLVLNDVAGHPTREAEAVLRAGAALAPASQGSGISDQ